MGKYTANVWKHNQYMILLFQTFKDAVPKAHYYPVRSHGFIIHMVVLSLSIVVHVADTILYETDRFFTLCPIYEGAHADVPYQCF